MRDRLIGLVDCASREYAEYTAEMFAEGSYGVESMEEYIADYLLKRGVIVPPCKVGDVVFALWSVPTEVKYVVYYAEVVDIHISKRNCKQTITFRLEPLGYRGRIREYFSDDFGKTVFLTKEEAEEALSKLQASYEQVKGGKE